MLNHTLILSPQTEYLAFISSTLLTTPIHITPPFLFPDVQQDSHRIPFRLDHAPCLLLLLSLAGCDRVRACVCLLYVTSHGRVLAWERRRRSS